MKTIIHTILLLLTVSVALSSETQTEKYTPDLKDAPVYSMFGKVVVFPNEVTNAPLGYQATMKGKAVLAIVKVDGEVVGEIYGNPLMGRAKDEADEMIGSGDGTLLINPINRETKKRLGSVHEISTLRLNVPSKFGKPWVAHSIYFPRGHQSVTFAFVTAEANFERLLPIFDAMFFTEEFIDPDKAKNATTLK